MSQQMRQLTIETPHQVFGAELRHWRTMRGISQAALGALTADSGALISKIEKADRVASLAFARRADNALDTGGALERLWRRVERATAEPVVDTADDAARFLPDNPWVSLPAAELLHEWQSHSAPATTHRIGGRRRVGKADIDIMWSICDTLTTTDRHLGGGYARDTLTTFLSTTVAPALYGSYSGSIAAELCTVSARLTNLVAFMSFDTARHTAARAWFRTALVLAKAADNLALAAHIFTDMAMQAHHTGQRTEAIALSEAAVRTSRRSGSPATVARSSALLARAHALAGDQLAAVRALAEAEQELDHAHPADEPAWVRFFTHEQLAAEAMYIASDGRQFGTVQKHAPLVRTAGAMERRFVLVSATLAASHVAHPDHVDVDQAAHILIETLPTAANVVSSRGLDAINAVRRQLAAHPNRELVAQLEQRYTEAMVPSR